MGHRCLITRCWRRRHQCDSGAVQLSAAAYSVAQDFCFAAHDGEASTARLTEWCRPELVGGRVKKWHLSNQERALHSIGARKVPAGVGCGDWMTVMGRQRNREPGMGMA